jgi:bifunctional DNA-binding transcriptional regulator/antitoxin component of YhaV-PrlF toxin-antitoxin module
MPLTDCVTFKAVIQRNRRIQIPVLIRWRFKLEPSEIFKVDLRIGYHNEEFYARMSKDGRLTVPKIIAQEFLEDSEEKSLNGYTAEVTLCPP